MAHALGLKRLDLYLQFERPLLSDELERLRGLLRRRGAGEPIAYLLGSWGFHDLDLLVDPRVLVPRPETELLVDLAVERLKGLEAPVVADVGTGSGCVALALLTALPAARALAIDISGEALEVAAANAERVGLSDRIDLLQGDLLQPARERPAWGGLDAVLSNPPYIVRGDPQLEGAVAAHEPEVALYVADDDPLSLTRALAQQAREGLRPGGWLLVELGAGSGQRAAELLTDLGYADVSLVPDLSGIDRVVAGREP